MASDIDSAARETYKENYGVTPLGDITKIDPVNVANYDILTCGTPCFIAGTRVTNDGYKNIEDVVLEDRLLTHTGKFQKIKSTKKGILW
jgi:site-specific DNA-cytosine methylase